MCMRLFVYACVYVYVRMRMCLCVLCVGCATYMLELRTDGDTVRVNVVLSLYHLHRHCCRLQTW